MKISVKGVNDVRRLLAKKSRNIEKAVASGLNAGTREIRSKLSKDIRQDLNVKKKTLDSRIRREFAKSGRLFAKVTLVQGGPVSLSHFRPRQTKKGVMVKVYKRGRPTFFRSAFGPKIPRLGKGVWRRRGSARLPIERMRGININRERAVRESVNNMRGGQAKTIVIKNVRRRLELTRIRGAR